MQKPSNALPFEFFLIMSFTNPLNVALLGKMILIGFAYVGIAQPMGTRFSPARSQPSSFCCFLNTIILCMWQMSNSLYFFPSTFTNLNFEVCDSICSLKHISPLKMILLGEILKSLELLVELWYPLQHVVTQSSFSFTINYYGFPFLSPMVQISGLRCSFVSFWFHLFVFGF